MILEDVVDHVVEQPFLRGNARQTPVFEPVQTVLCADPKCALVILVDGPGVIIRQAVAPGEGAEATVLEPV